jgi:hypothetical protein
MGQVPWTDCEYPMCEKELTRLSFGAIVKVQIVGSGGFATEPPAPDLRKRSCREAGSTQVNGRHHASVSPVPRPPRVSVRARELHAWSGGWLSE